MILKKFVKKFILSGEGGGWYYPLLLKTCRYLVQGRLQSIPGGPPPSSSPRVAGRGIGRLPPYTRNPFHVIVKVSFDEGGGWGVESTQGFKFIFLLKTLS